MFDPDIFICASPLVLFSRRSRTPPVPFVSVKFCEPLILSVPMVRVPRSPIVRFAVTISPRVAVTPTAFGLPVGVQLAVVSQLLLLEPSHWKVCP